MNNTEGAWMTERSELLEATLECHPEGIALVAEQCRVVLWNHSAEAITGFLAQDLLGRPAPEVLKPLLNWCAEANDPKNDPASPPEHGCLCHILHKRGHELQVFARVMILRDGLAARIGAAIIFHPAESLDALPHGESCESLGSESSQADFEDRLEALFDDCAHGGLPFGVLWITVDQAHDLRRTHGAGASEAMLHKLEMSMARGLRPGEELHRWGADEFLILSHERTPQLLADHAQLLAGLARTADFRWWGDRTSLTVSIGAAQANPDRSLAELLEHSKAAMLSSVQAGGNCITSASGENACSPS